MIKQFWLEVNDFFRQIYINRRLILELTRREFGISYAENLFGLLWAFIEPLAMMVILWFVFSYLRSGPAGSEVPFSIYLLSGILAYDFFNKGLNKGSRSIKAYNFLVKTVNFRVAVIPIINISSELIIHLIVMSVLVVILVLNSIFPSFYWFQVIYYLMAQYILLIGLCWLTASILPFFPDISYIITITMRVLFFMTPIFWDISMIPESFAKIIKLNPLVYIVGGYRDSFLYHVPFWDHRFETIYFWAFTFITYALGIVVFKRLRPHFADVI
jgi:lipopolysaccharide transport system permease protein/teichoic acid transport system permease protein